MQRERYWFGTAVLAVPFVFLLLVLIPRREVSPGAPLEGQVKIDGRPMAGGFILFVPEDPANNLAVGAIDAQGHYRIGARWLRKSRDGETRFRICLIPRPNPASEDSVEESEPAAAPEARPRSVIKGPMEATRVAAGFPRRLSDPRTSELEVRLGVEPARVDITL